MPTHIGYDGADQQERYCRGYCAQRRFEVAEVCLDSTPAGSEAGWPGLQRAVRAVEDGRAHLLVTLDAKHIAEDDEALVAIQTCIPHIEYAESYAYELLLRGFVEAMERLKPILEQIERRRAATGRAEDAGTTPDGART